MLTMYLSTLFSLSLQGTAGLGSVIFNSGQNWDAKITSTQQQQQQPKGVCCLDIRCCCSGSFKTFGRTSASNMPFSRWKSQTIQMAPLKHCNGSLQRVRDCVGPCPDGGGCTSISAALEDTAVALMMDSTLAIRTTSKPGTTLWTMLISVCCQAPLSPRCGD